MNLKTFLKVFALDAAFIASLLLVFAFLRKKITFYLSLLAGYQGGIQTLDPADAVGVQEVLAGLSNAANTTMWLLIAAPVVVYLLYVVLEGLGFLVVRPREKYLLKFGAATLPVYLFFVLSLYYLWLDWVMVTLLAVLSYLTFLFYLRPYRKGWMKLLKNPVMVPVFLGYFALGFLAGGFFLLFYLESLILAHNYWFLLLGMVFLLGLSCFKVWMVERFG